MLILAKAVLSMMIGFILSVILGLVLIPLLKKIKAGQKVSIFLAKTHKEKDGVPTMGGLIFIISTLITVAFLLLTGKMQFSAGDESAFPLVCKRGGEGVQRCDGAEQPYHHAGGRV